MLDILFTAFLGERELEELLPEDEAERERLLQDTNTNKVLFFLYGQDIVYTTGPSINIKAILVNYYINTINTDKKRTLGNYTIRL